MVLIHNATHATCFQLTLIEEFALHSGDRRLSIPHAAERVLTYLALLNRPVSRGRLAGALWPECADHCAAQRLRTALWRLRRIQDAVVEINGDRLRLHPDVVVDLAYLTELAQKLVHQPCSEDLARVPLLLDRAALLADWDEEWVVVDRERYRLAWVAALEAAAEALLERRQVGAALMAASAVAAAEPLRESSRRILMRIHLAQGNKIDALREYRRYRDLLWAEFDTEPSPEFDELLLRVQKCDAPAVESLPNR
ncbi:BTAD domain-containing putative transcriptional regulator [Nocardia sp. NPDC004168]|uniref:AfsR/SARP family transcriptional regulator n=1 Tax=Nocardia sp. NPDC004168 TaxID=3154452 RepID=UPI0033BAF856